MLLLKNFNQTETGTLIGLGKIANINILCSFQMGLVRQERIYKCSISGY